MNEQITPDRSQVRTPGDDIRRGEAPGDAAAGARRLRLWPGLVMVLLMWPVLILPSVLAPGSMAHFMSFMMGPMIFAAVFGLWWVFGSRQSWLDGLAIPAACAAFAAASIPLSDPDFRQMGHYTYGLPAALTAWALWLLMSGGLSWPARRAGLLVVLLLVWAACTLFRMDGVTGSFQPELSFRWSPRAEDRYERYRTERGASKAEAKAERIERRPGDWPGFRGPNRDGRLAGVRVGTDWKASPPKELWRRPIGPGWSSFAVVGSRVYTQEQRGDDEVVVCLDAATGKELWAHADQTRFKELVSGPGPRATPTFHDSKIYALGANGTLNCLDAATGERLWKADVAADAGLKKPPTWGFSASPLVAHGIVSVYAGGPDGKAVLGYDAAKGGLKWSGGTGLDSYGSTQLMTLAGVEQLVVLTGHGATSLDPKSGTVMWEHDWPMAKGMARCVQPAAVSGDELLIGTGFNQGTRRVKVRPKNSPPWDTEEVWTTKDVNPYFNDLVVHDGHLYGFDGLFFTCVSLEDGGKAWRQRGYANGQVLLLADQGLLLIVSEAGEVSLVEASPEKHSRLASLKAVTGKTWNHPVVAHGKLFVRNGEEVACYELPAAK